MLQKLRFGVECILEEEETQALIQTRNNTTMQNLIQSVVSKQVLIAPNTLYFL